jgi:hypothetical protein
MAQVVEHLPSRQAQGPKFIIPQYYQDKEINKKKGGKN